MQFIGSKSNHCYDGKEEKFGREQLDCSQRMQMKAIVTVVKIKSPQKGMIHDVYSIKIPNIYENHTPMVAKPLQR